MPITFLLDSRPNKRSEFPIKISWCVKNTRILTTCGYSVTTKMWNPLSQQVRKGFVNSKKITFNKINARISLLRSAMENYEINLEYGDRPSREDLLHVLHDALGASNHRKKIPSIDFYSVFDAFLSSESRDKAWAYGTVRKFITMKHHLTKYYPKMTFADLSEEWLSDYLHLLESDLHLQDVSVKKELKLIKWFLKWAIKYKFCNNNNLLDFGIKTKETKKPVVFLEPEELMKLYTFQVPENHTMIELVTADGKKYFKEVIDKSGLEKARDLFCFCCFTSLRYSDMAQLYKKDIYDGAIHLISQKTNDKMDIQLLPYAQAILERHKDLRGSMALPVISNQKLNCYLKDLCELCGINQLMTTTRYKQGRRYDEVIPKYQMMTSHAGRRTFVCMALSVGVPPEVVMKWTGHNDYAAMKPYIDVTDNSLTESMKKIMENFRHV